MYMFDFQIVFQEVPGEVSICFSITGCSLNCNGCHSPYLWKETNGQKLTQIKYSTILERYKDFASCVLFMGGEWHPDTLHNYLKLAKKNGYKTCLYTGENIISKKITKQLDWLKTGKWIESLGGLESIKTNQEFIEVSTNKKLNHLFHKN